MPRDQNREDQQSLEVENSLMSEVIFQFCESQTGRGRKNPDPLSLPEGERYTANFLGKKPHKNHFFGR